MYSATKLAHAVRVDTLRQFDRIANDFEALRDAKMLMTGCSGLFGLWLIDLIDVANRELGTRIQMHSLTRCAKTSLSRYPHFATIKDLYFIEADVRAFQLGTLPVTHLIHGATTSASETFHGEQGLAKFATLVDGSRALFSQLPKGSLQSALFLSSGVVYGGHSHDDGGFSEDSALAPQPSNIDAALGHAKRAAEFICHAFAQEKEFLIRVARCFSFSGAGVPLNLHYALGDFLRQASSQHEIIVRSDGEARRSYMHLGDMAIWLVKLLSDPDRKKPGTVNVGSPEAISIRELALAVAQRFKPVCEVNIQGKSDYSVGNTVRQHYVPATENAKRFGLSNWTPLSMSIDTMLTSLA